MLEFYRNALRIRRTHPALGDGAMTWLQSPTDVLAFHRNPGFVCVINMSTAPVALNPNDEVLLASEHLIDGLLPPDTGVWLRTT
jgi:alpha-glucosidase